MVAYMNSLLWNLSTRLIWICRWASTASVKSKLFRYYLPREICCKSNAFNLEVVGRSTKKQYLRKKNASTKINLERFLFKFKDFYILFLLSIKWQERTEWRLVRTQNGNFSPAKLNENPRLFIIRGGQRAVLWMASTRGATKIQQETGNCR